jgi:phosphoribosylformylglycinamidine synthase
MNCEVETVRTLKRVGLNAEVVLWNEDSSKLQNYQAIVIPGGFSFEDRGRSGLVAAKEPILKEVIKEAAQGKPVLGICNGAQVLIEAGLVPGVSFGISEMGLAPNKRISPKGEVLGVGFYHAWVQLKNNAKPGRSVFNNFSPQIILKMPVAHGEGRFLASPQIQKELINNQQIIFSYCDSKGSVQESFPTNPNGSLLNAAGIANKNGNVLALMPHPERTFSCDQIFNSLKEYLENPKPQAAIEIAKPQKNELLNLPQVEQGAIEFFISLKITDNTEKTIETALRKIAHNSQLSLKRRSYFSFNSQDSNLLQLAQKLANSGEIFNPNKENCLIRIADKTYKFIDGQLLETEWTIDRALLSQEIEDLEGQAKKAHLQNHLAIELDELHSGTVWQLEDLSPELLTLVVQSQIFANQVAGKLSIFQ